MAASRPLRLAPEWDDRFARMIGLSALGHALVVAAAVLLAGHVGTRPLPMVAYTVELTDPSAVGGRLPPGAPGRDLSGGPAGPPASPPKAEPAEPPPPPPKAEPAEPAKPPEPKPEPKPVAAEETTVHIPEKPKPPEPPKPEAKPPEPKPEAKPPEPPKPQAKAQEPARSPEPPKAEAKKPEPPKPSPAKPPEPPKTTASSAGSPGGREEATPRDAYSAAAERWRQRSGGGLGGNDAGSGPIGSGGEGKGGGGQLVGLEFIAYRQQVINTIKAQWTNVLARPGMVAAVRFEIAPDGQVSNVRLAQSSGNPAYDASALRAVQHVGQLPPPPARYMSEFHEFVIEFHSEESGGRGAG